MRKNKHLKKSLMKSLRAIGVNAEVTSEDVVKVDSILKAMKDLATGETNSMDINKSIEEFEISKGIRR